MDSVNQIPHIESNDNFPSNTAHNQSQLKYRKKSHSGLMLNQETSDLLLNEEDQEQIQKDNFNSNEFQRKELIFPTLPKLDNRVNMSKQISKIKDEEDKYESAIYNTLIRKGQQGKQAWSILNKLEMASEKSQRLNDSI